MQNLRLHRKKGIKTSNVVVVLFLISCFLGNDVNAQKQVVAAKPLATVDSLMVKQLFFSAIREKTIENTKHAAEMFERILQTDPSNDASMFELANIKKSHNDYIGAQPLLEKAVAINPDNEWYWVALADSYEKSNSINKLENVFNQLIRLNPDKSEYYFDKANAYTILKRYDDALKVYDELEKLNGPSDDILANRQKIYLKQGKIEQAASEL